MRELAKATGGIHLRIDSIEQALRNCGLDVTKEGYVAGYAIAEENCKHAGRRGRSRDHGESRRGSAEGMTRRKKTGMTPADFSRVALSFDGAEQGSHMGSVDFRVGGRIFATLASQALGYGNLALNPEQQAAFCDELPDVFLPIAGGWGRMGMTHIVLAKASEDVLRGALETAWRLRVEANTRARKRPASKRRKPSAV